MFSYFRKGMRRRKGRGRAETKKGRENGRRKKSGKG